jgi:hypothetical protein
MCDLVLVPVVSQVVDMTAERGSEHYALNDTIHTFNVIFVGTVNRLITTAQQAHLL